MLLIRLVLTCHGITREERKKEAEFIAWPVQDCAHYHIGSYRCGMFFGWSCMRLSFEYVRLFPDPCRHLTSERNSTEQTRQELLPRRHSTTKPANHQKTKDKDKSKSNRKRQPLSIITQPSTHRDGSKRHQNTADTHEAPLKRTPGFRAVWKSGQALQLLV